MQKLLKVTKFAPLVLIGALLVGCGGNQAPAGGGAAPAPAPGGGGAGAEASAPDHVPHIELISKGFQHDFWQAVYAGARQAAETHNATINFVGPPTEAHIAEQVDMLNVAINLGPDAIGFAALDTGAALDAIYRAMDAGIPMIGFDSGVPDAPEGSILANASTDNVAAGALAATYMYPAIQDRIGGDLIRVGVLVQEVQGMSNYGRARGFIDEMYALLNADANVTGVSIVGHTLFNNNVSDYNVVIEVRVPAEITNPSGQAEAMALLNMPDLVGIFGANEFSANVMIFGNDALANGRLGVDVVGIGFDAGTLQIDAVRNEVFFGSITQDPVSIGYYTVFLALEALAGRTVSDVDTGARFWYHGNVDNPEIWALLYE